jgi:hypothetical protein
MIQVYEEDHSEDCSEDLCRHSAEQGTGTNGIQALQACQLLLLLLLLL